MYVKHVGRAKFYSSNAKQRDNSKTFQYISDHLLLIKMIIVVPTPSIYLKKIKY